MRAAAGILLLGALAAVLLLSPSPPSTRTTHSHHPRKQGPTVDRISSAEPSKSLDFLAGFEARLEVESERMAAAARGGADGIDSGFAYALQVRRRDVNLWLAGLDRGAVLAISLRPRLHRILRREALGPSAPAGTAVLLIVLRELPQLAPPGLLQTIATSALTEQSLRIEALHVLALAARAGDVPFLTVLLREGGSDEAPLALAALASVPEGRAVVKTFLAAGLSSATEWTNLTSVLLKSGLVTDREIVSGLLSSASIDEVEMTGRAISLADRPTDDSHVAGLLSAIARDDSLPERVGASAVEALGNCGQSGRTALQRIAGDPDVGARDRLSALSILAPEPSVEFVGLAEALLMESERTDEARRALRLLLSVESADVAAASARDWLRDHPDRLDDLISAFSRSPRHSDQAFGELLAGRHGAVRELVNEGIR